MSNVFLTFIDEKMKKNILEKGVEIKNGIIKIGDPVILDMLEVIKKANAFDDLELEFYFHKLLLFVLQLFLY